LRFVSPITCVLASPLGRLRFPRSLALSAGLLIGCAARFAAAQEQPRSDSASASAVHPDSAARDSATHHSAARARHLNWFVFLAGGFTSLGLHETGHIVASYAVGAHPSFAFNKGRPTIYSGIDATTNPGKQFIFSSAGLTVQTVLDEAIIDIPHSRGSTFERGILFGGLATTAFYITLGRNGSVSDVEYMARTSSLSKWGVSAIYGGIAATQVLRMSFMGAYAHFFAEPLPPEGRAKYGAFNIGVRLTPSA
jgi:hypothetical protein